MKSRMNFYVLVVGTDGSGKTSVASGICNHFEKNYGKSPLHKHFKIWDTHLDKNSAIENYNPVNQKTRNLVFQYIFILYKFIKYMSFFKKNSKCKFVIQERGWLDQITDYSRYRLSNRLRKLVIFLNRFLKKPDLVIILKGNPVKITKRKLEKSVSEILEIQSRFDSTYKGHNFIEFDCTSLGIDEIVENSIASIKEIYVSKTLKIQKNIVGYPSRLNLRMTSRSAEYAKSLYHPAKIIGLLARELTAVLPQKRHSIFQSDRVLFSSLIRNGFLPTKWAIISSSTKGRLICVFSTLSNEKFVAKYSPNLDPGIQNEFKILTKLSTLPTSFFIPQAMKFYENSEETLLVTKFEQLGSISKKIPFENADNLAKEIAALGFSHGDYSWWNIGYGTSFFLVDWEEGSEVPNYSSEILHFRNSLQNTSWNMVH